MIVRTIKTAKVAPGAITLLGLLDKELQELREGSILVIASKIAALCEGRTVPRAGISKRELAQREADLFANLPPTQHGMTFTIIDNVLIPNAGVDESNVSGDTYVLWPSNPQAAANAVRQYAAERFGLKQIGVIIADSTVRPLQWGVGGISIAHSGFAALNDYRGQADLYGRPCQAVTSSVAGGLAAAAVLVMGEGAEQTPLAVITDVPFVRFQNRNPSKDELEALTLSIHDDLYGPLLGATPWLPGDRQADA